MASYLGIDLGTSGVKAVLIDGGGTVLASATAPLTVSRPHPGWSEQDPEDWWTATCAALDALHASHPAALAAVRGIGLSGQMHGATLLDAADRPLRPCILWNDGRSGGECAVLEGRADFPGIGGNRVMAGFTAPKLEWVRAHEPDIFAATRTVLLPKDYLRLLLTGEKASDMSDAAGTLWMDVGARAWSPDLLAATGLSLDHMPRLFEGTEATGTLRPALAARWGMAAAPVVAGGGGDNAASACGVGAVAPGTGFLSIGTSGVLFLATPGFMPNTARAVHAFCHAVPGVWHQMAVILAAADSLSWLARLTGRDAAALAAMVDPADEPAAVPLFLPYLSGERTPHNDPGARGAFLNLGQESDAGVLARAVLEGVAYALADGLDALRTAGSAPGPVAVVGGGAQSDAWVQIVADATGLTLDRPQGGEAGAALGAARLGLCAAEGADPRAVCTAPPVDRRFTPEPGRAARHAERRGRFAAAYAATGPLRG